VSSLLLFQPFRPLHCHHQHQLLCLHHHQHTNTFTDSYGLWNPMLLKTKNRLLV
jgi:hypothetical protein